MFFFVNTYYSPDSADRASKTAGTFETLVAGHFPLHSGFFLGLVDTHTDTQRERQILVSSLTFFSHSFTRIQSAHKTPLMANTLLLVVARTLLVRFANVKPRCGVFCGTRCECFNCGWEVNS